MNNQIERSNNQNAALCEWCDIPLGSAGLYKELVCIRCYKKLIAAGLKDEEIFPRRADGEKNKKPGADLTH